MDYATRLRELGCEPGSESADSDIGALELELGVTLPSEYRGFLVACGDWWGDVACPCREPTPFGTKHWVNGFHDAGEVSGLLDSMITPRNMITIGWGHFAKYTCLSVAGIDRGAVYALDGESRAYWPDEEFEQRFNSMADEIRNYLNLRRGNELPEKPAGYNCAYLLADSFAEFLENCTPSE